MLENGGGGRTVCRDQEIRPWTNPFRGIPQGARPCCPWSSALNSSRYSCCLLPTMIFCCAHTVLTVLPVLRVMSILSANHVAVW